MEHSSALKVKGQEIPYHPLIPLQKSCSQQDKRLLS